MRRCGLELQAYLPCRPQQFEMSTRVGQIEMMAGARRAPRQTSARRKQASAWHEVALTERREPLLGADNRVLGLFGPLGLCRLFMLSNDAVNERTRNAADKWCDPEEPQLGSGPVSYIESHTRASVLFSIFTCHCSSTYQQVSPASARGVVGGLTGG